MRKTQSHQSRLLGRYAIVAELGRGAMGVVYKASDPKIDRLVAIKTISLNGASPAEQKEFRKRFFIEAQAAGRLLHPGIVTVFDVAEDPETLDPFIVMEYIEGQNLRDLMLAKKIPLDRALKIGQDLAEALDYAHAQGVVHRDIKPANILITQDGQAKITDFGIAQLDFSQITMPGRVLGSPAYMSPEQLEDGPVDGRSDLFSLGAILYSLVTGFSPFQGNSATTVCFKVVNREPLRATTLSPDLPPQLDSIIVRALAKTPEERYQRGTDLANDLRNLRDRMRNPSHGHKDTIYFSQEGEPQNALKAPLKAPKQPPDQSFKPIVISAQEPKKSDRAPASSFSAWKPLLAAAAMVLMAAAVGFIVFRQKTSFAMPPEIPPAQQVAAQVAPAATQTLTVQPQPTTPATVATPTLPAVAGSAPSPKPKARQSLLTSDRPAPTMERMPVDHAPLVPTKPAPVISDSNLRIEVDNHLAQAELSVWIDNNLQYEHPLDVVHKRLGFLKGTRATVTLPLVSGLHQLRLRVLSQPDQYDESKSISGEFLKGGDKTLSVSFEKHSREMLLNLH